MCNRVYTIQKGYIEYDLRIIPIASLLLCWFFPQIASVRLEETSAELARTSKALSKEKKKTDMLLYQMLPVKVANSLRDGKKVDAGRDL